MLPGWKPSQWTLLGYKGPGHVYVQETPLPDAIGYQAWVPGASTWSEDGLEWHSEGDVYNTFDEAAAAAMKWIEIGNTPTKREPTWGEDCTAFEPSRDQEGGDDGSA